MYKMIIMAWAAGHMIHENPTYNTLQECKAAIPAVIHRLKALPDNYRLQQPACVPLNQGWKEILGKKAWECYRYGSCPQGADGEIDVNIYIHDRRR
jgi:hypothetical protein